MNEKEIRREIKVCKFGAVTALIGAFVPIIGAIIIMALVDPVVEKSELAGLVALTMAMLCLVLALGLAMCGALFLVNHRQGENSLRLLEIVAKARVPRAEGS